MEKKSIDPFTLAVPCSWAEHYYRKIRHWNELDRGGHFAGFEQADLLIGEVHTCFRQMRQEDQAGLKL